MDSPKMEVRLYVNDELVRSVTDDTIWSLVLQAMLKIERQKAAQPTTDKGE